MSDIGGDPPCWAHLLDNDDSEPPNRETMDQDQQIDAGTLAGLVDALADAVVICDVDGIITYWNSAALRIFGWDADHALGLSLDLIIPEKLRRAHWDGYRKVMESGETRYGDDLLRVPSLHADGERRSIAFTVTLLKDSSGVVQGIAAVVRDETERWAQEQELRRVARDAGTLPQP